MIIKRIFTTAILAGVSAALVLTAMQWIAAVPLVLQAEQFEGAGHDHGTAAHDRGTAGQDHGGAAWAPADGAERWFFTFLTNVVVAVGFGLLLAAAYALRGRCDWRQGLLWGLAGFGAVHLAPALGLPPELPGAPAAELGARQAWWLLTVVCTAGGLAAAVFLSSWVFKGAGVALILLPHIVGAPVPEVHASALPAHLAAEFVAVSLVTNAAFWLSLGAASGYLFQREARHDQQQSALAGT